MTGEDIFKSALESKTELESERIYWKWEEIPIENVVLADNIRAIDDEVVEELALSILENGQLQPCIGDMLYTEDGEEIPRIIAGQHRYHAIRLLNEHDIYTPIIVRIANRNLTPEEVISIQMSENLQNKMTPEQDAKIIHSYWEGLTSIGQKLTYIEISRKLGRSPKKVSDAIRYIEELSPKVQEMVGSSLLSYSTALLLTKLDKENLNGGMYAEQVRVALFLISERYTANQTKKYLSQREKEKEFAGPLFTGEVWDSLKSNGYKIAIRDRASKEGKQAAGWFSKMTRAVSLLDNPSKAEFSSAIERAVVELGISLKDFYKELEEMGVEVNFV